MQFVVAIVALLVGAAFCFAGFRFFLILLPIYGFVIGFNIGTDATTAIFGDGTFATVTSWVIGLVVAVVIAVLSYLFYYAAVALLGGAVGYAIGASAWGLIGNEYGAVAFVIGLVCGVALAVVVLLLNVPKYLVIVISGLGGAAAILAGWFVLIGKVPDDSIHWTVIGKLITENWLYLIIWGVLAAAGIIAQMRAPAIGPDAYELERDSYRYY
jgi:hypothetical protein